MIKNRRNYFSKSLAPVSLSLAVALGVGGCVKQMNTPPDKLDPTPISADEAMQHRNWQISPAVYANTGVPAQPTGFLYQSRRDQPYLTYSLSETPVFLLNTMLLPFAFAMTPPWQTIQYRAATVEPTYSAMPVLPPSRSGIVVEDGANVDESMRSTTSTESMAGSTMQATPVATPPTMRPDMMMPSRGLPSETQSPTMSMPMSAPMSSPMSAPTPRQSMSQPMSGSTTMDRQTPRSVTPANIVPTTMPTRAPAERPLDDAPNTLPRPTSGPMIRPGGAGRATPEPAVPAAPAKHVDIGGAPHDLPTTKMITPSTNPAR